MSKIAITKYYIEIKANADDPELACLMSNISIYKQRTKDTYRASLRVLPEVLRLIRGIVDSSQLPDGAAKQYYEAELQRRAKTEQLKLLGPEGESKTLWKHQQLGVELAAVNKRYNFFYDTRTGKTRMAFQIMLNKLLAGEVKRCIVVCPATIVQSWLSDAADAYPELKVVAYYKDAKTQYEALHKPAHVIIWSSGTFANNLELIKQCKFDLCVFDESSKLKNYSSEISKAAVELSASIPYWYNLSATPAPNGEHEFYMQMRCLDAYCFNPARTHFVNKYFDNTSRNNNYERLVLKDHMRSQFMKVINDYSIFVDQQVMETPGKEWHIVPFTLTTTELQQYEQMRTDMAVDVEGHEDTITADQAAAMRNKLNQITSGFIIDSEAVKQNDINKKLGFNVCQQTVFRLTAIPCSRIAALNRLLCSLQYDSVVIWANYTEEFKMIRELLADKCAIIRGGSSTADKEAAIAAFKQHKVQYLVAHPLSIGMGINLTVAHHAVYYSVTDSWEALKQSSERIYGNVAVQPVKCHYWVIQATDTVDELIYENVTNKRDASTGFLEHLKSPGLQGT